MRIVAVLTLTFLTLFTISAFPLSHSCETPCQSLPPPPEYPPPTPPPSPPPPPPPSPVPILPECPPPPAPVSECFPCTNPPSEVPSPPSPVQPSYEPPPPAGDAYFAPPLYTLNPTPVYYMPRSSASLSVHPQLRSLVLSISLFLTILLIYPHHS